MPNCVLIALLALWAGLSGLTLLFMYPHRYYNHDGVFGVLYMWLIENKKLTLFGKIFIGVFFTIWMLPIVLLGLIIYGIAYLILTLFIKSED